jgi:hypothetical protein
VYVWAMCQGAESEDDPATSAPAVIYLGTGEAIDRVEVPGDGDGYPARIRKLFPPELHEKILSQSINTGEMWSNIQRRHETPGVPLIVTSGVPLP